MDNAPEEKRKYQRKTVKEPVRYQFKNPSGYGGCLSADISESGIRIVISEFIPLKSHVRLQVLLPTGKYAEAESRVMWVTKYPLMERYQIGLEFIEPYEAKQLIHQYVQWSD